MATTFGIGWLIAALLLSLRVAAATLVAPVFGPSRVPGTTRVCLSLALGAVMVPVVAPAPVPVSSLAQLLGAMLTELIVGASLGFGFLAAYGATQVAGRVLDVQIGFGVAAILNPATGNISPLLGTLFGTLFVAVFLSMDGHHVLLQALALSAQATPPGSMIESLNWTAIVAQSGVIFTWALALAGPVMLMLLLVDLAMAVISRSMPQLNVFILSFTLKIVVGLVVLAASIPIAGGVFRGLADTAFRYWTPGEGPVP